MKNRIICFLTLTTMLMSTASFAQNVRKGMADKERYSRIKQNANENDSLQLLKNTREFAYMNYLDSLLRNNKNLRVDTADISMVHRKGELAPAKADNSKLNRFLNSDPVRIFFWMAAVFFIGFIIYKIFLKNDLFARGNKKLLEKEVDFPLTALDEPFKYDPLINDAELKNDFNLATRFLYLKTLKILSDKEFIHFSPEKTNREYLSEMATNAYLDRFSSLTRKYEYAWYGKFLIDLTSYNKLKEEFTRFNNNFYL